MSWLEEKPILVTDAGDAGHEGDRYDEDVIEDGVAIHKKGDLIIDVITGEVKGKRDPRPAWPPDTGVYTKPRITGHDLNEINRLTARISLAGKAADASNLDIRADLEIYVPSIIQMAVLGRGFTCPLKTRDDCPKGKAGDKEFEEANAFEDPKTRPDYVDDTNPGTPGTGKVLAWPKELAERVKVAGRLPSEVLLFYQEEVQRLAGIPLPGSQDIAKT